MSYLVALFGRAIGPSHVREVRPSRRAVRRRAEDGVHEDRGVGGCRAGHVVGILRSGHDHDGGRAREASTASWPQPPLRWVWRGNGVDIRIANADRAAAHPLDLFPLLGRSTSNESTTDGRRAPNDERGPSCQDSGQRTSAGVRAGGLPPSTFIRRVYRRPSSCRAGGRVGGGSARRASRRRC